MKSISKYLNIDSVHDCNMTGIIVSEEETLNLIISDLEGKAKNILFIETKYCRFDDFRLGNIILSLEVYDDYDIQIIDDYLCYILDIDKKDLSKDFVLKLKNAIYSKELILVVLEPSYGAMGVIICKDAKLKE